MSALTLALLALALGSAPALAQTERLPATSRAERQVNDINRSLQTQQQDLRQNQQTQFEVNQLRSEVQRRPVIGPGSNPGCPAGSVGC